MIIIGDVLDKLAGLPSDHFDCVVTSPPYWGLRDYGAEGQIGLEPTMQEHIDKMVAVCAEIHRVLKPSGTFWLNYGDCYRSTQSGNGGYSDKSTLGGFTNPETKGRQANESGQRRPIDSGLKPKDLCMIPNRIAIALQEAGWWVRSEIVWAKPNPMPESVTDRPATAHEKIWLMTKAPRYFYDAGAVRVEAKRPDWAYETATTPGNNDRKDGGCTQRKTDKAKMVWKGDGTIESPYYRGLPDPPLDKQRGHSHAGFNDRWDKMTREEQQAGGRNLRNYEPAPVQVWEMATRPFPGAHFATFPPELVERCLLAGCPKCGKVLDPFGGAGTVGLVADSLNLDWTLIELNPEYAAMAEARIKARVAGKGSRERCEGTAELFGLDTAPAKGAK